MDKTTERRFPERMSGFAVDAQHSDYHVTQNSENDDPGTITHMQVGLTTIDSLTNALIQQTDGLEGVGEFSFGAALEFAVWAHENLTAEVQPLLTKWGERTPIIAEAFGLLRGANVAASYQPHLRVWQGLRPIRLAHSVIEDAWNQFLERFAAALKAAGFKNGWNQAMAGVFHEMADNIVQHSTLASNQPINGIAGYSVQDRRMAFTVADTGVGAANSLKDNPRYANVANGREALDLIAHEKASRRAGQGAVGGGYSALFLKLAAMNGTIRLRSADGVFMMQGTLGCSAVAKSIHTAPGFAISVECEI